MTEGMKSTKDHTHLLLYSLPRLKAWPSANADVFYDVVTIYDRTLFSPFIEHVMSFSTVLAGSTMKARPSSR